MSEAEIPKTGNHTFDLVMICICSCFGFLLLCNTGLRIGQAYYKARQTEAEENSAGKTALRELELRLEELENWKVKGVIEKEAFDKILDKIEEDYDKIIGYFIQDALEVKRRI